MNKRTLACVAVGVMASGAAGQVTITSGFNNQSGWALLLVNSSSNFGSIIQTGGNPGGYADLNSVLQSSTAGGAGFKADQFFFLGSLTSVVLTADVKWFAGQELQLVPFLVQSNLLNLPSSFIPTGTSSSWSTFGPVTFPLSTFSNSTGTPLNTSALVQTGFVAMIRSQTPTSASGHVGIDNVTLQVVPAPATGVVGVMGLCALRRRRR